MLWPARRSRRPARSQQQNELLLRQLQEVHQLSDQQMATIRAIFAGSSVLGQGNPAIVEHPMTPEQCRAKLEQRSVRLRQSRIRAHLRRAGTWRRCTIRTRERPEDAKACIDQFEFPDIPCTYPVVWVRAREAAELCAAMGKRLCDAHEWEGACAGRLEPPDYRFDLADGVSPNAAVERMRKAHNQAHEADKTWSYGPAYRTGVCAAAQPQEPDLRRRRLVAVRLEHLPDRRLPRLPQPARRVRHQRQRRRAHEPAARPGARWRAAAARSSGYTEMKGSWFIFDRYRAHEDWCRWRAPFWHGSRVMDPKSHAELPPRLPLLQDAGRRRLTRRRARRGSVQRPPWAFPRCRATRKLSTRR